MSKTRKTPPPPTPEELSQQREEFDSVFGMQQTPWIPCKEQLPGLHIPVLGYCVRTTWFPSDERSRAVVVFRYAQDPSANDKGNYIWLTPFGPGTFSSFDISH